MDKIKKEFVLFTKRLTFDYSEYQELFDALQQRKIQGALTFTLINSPERLKGKFTYIAVKKKPPYKFIENNKFLNIWWNLYNTEKYKVKFR